MSALALDLELPDEAISVSDLQDGSETLQDATAVQAAAQALASQQRTLRLELLERLGLSMTGHVLSDEGPLSPSMLGALRVAMLSGEELRNFGDASDPEQGALSEESERQVCETLQAVLSGMAESVAEMDDSDGTASCMLAILHHSLSAVAQLEASLQPGGQRKRRREDEADGDASGDSEARRWLEQELEDVQRQRLALDGEEARLRAKLSQLPSAAPAAAAAAAAPSDADADAARPPLAPWTVGAGSVVELLRELGLEPKYAERLAAAGLHRADELLRLGHAGLAKLLGGTDTPAAPDDDDARALLALAASARPCGASGAAWSGRFLRACRSAHDAHMGCENMGQFLYALCRFVKPSRVLEVGAGYTSLWLLQALADNEAELRRCAQAARHPDDGYLVSGNPWMRPWVASTRGDGAAAGPMGACGDGGGRGDGDGGGDCGGGGERAVLHCVDDMSHANTTAHAVRAVAARLGTDVHLRLHKADAYDLAARWERMRGARAEGCPRDERAAEQPLDQDEGLRPEQPAGAADEDQGPPGLDVLWLDFGSGVVAGRLDEFLSAWWPRLRPGGLLLLHSALTNSVTRHWLEAARARARGGDSTALDAATAAAAAPGRGVDPFGGDGVETLSLLEPHKRFQNSVSIFQRRPVGWAGEPLLTTFP